jgi:anti-repressor protein
MQLFNFGGHQLRTIDKSGEPLFIAKDVCEILGIDNSQIRRLDEDEKGLCSIQTPGGEQSMVCINEAGLYGLILGSRKAEAKAFKRWVTHEVIPSIRKHGAYMTSETIERTLFNPDYLLQLAQRLKDEQTARIAAESKLIEQRPLIVFAESLQVSKDTMLVGELAKLLKQNGIEIGQTRLFERLREEGYLHKVGSQKNLPTQKSMELGLMEIRLGVRASVSEGSKTTKTTKITGKGQAYFINKFKSRLLSEAQ